MRAEVVELLEAARQWHVVEAEETQIRWDGEEYTPRECIVDDLAPLADVGPAGRALLESCVDYLLVTRGGMSGPPYPPTVWDFVCAKIGVSRGDGLDYYVLGLLDWYGVTEHGGGIRASWWRDDKSNPYQGRTVDAATRRDILDWIAGDGVVHRRDQ